MLKPLRRPSQRAILSRLSLLVLLWTTLMPGCGSSDEETHDDCDDSEACSSEHLDLQHYRVSVSINEPPGPFQRRRPNLPYNPAIVRLGSNRTLSLGQTEDVLCVLSGLGGKFAGAAESVELQSDQGKWVVKTRSKQPEELFAEVTCLPKDDFFDTANSQWTAETTFELSSSSGAQLNTETGTGRFATALSGISGALQGRGEWAKIRNRTYPDRSELWVKSAQGYIKAYATRFGMTAPFNNYPQSGSLTLQVLASSNGPREVKLAYIDFGICFLQQISGNFDGGSETVRIRPVNNHWVLSVTGACIDGDHGVCHERKSVHATASCYQYEQRY